MKYRIRKRLSKKQQLICYLNVLALAFNKLADAPRYHYFVFDDVTKTLVPYQRKGSRVAPK